MALTTGMRIGEILNLKWGQIDLENGLIHVEISKNKQRRSIPINESLRKEIELLPPKMKDEYIFPHSSKYPRGCIKRMWKKILEKAGLSDFRFHDLRHTFASYVMMKKGNVPLLQDLLGHKDSEMTLRYSHLSPKYRMDAVRVMDEVIKM